MCSMWWDMVGDVLENKTNQNKEILFLVWNPLYNVTRLKVKQGTKAIEDSIADFTFRAIEAG